MDGYAVIRHLVLVNAWRLVRGPYMSAAAVFIPRLASAPCILGYPQSRFSVAMRTTHRWISSCVRGRPGPRCLLPSYFMAISFRCQAKSVSGVTMVASSWSTRRPGVLALPRSDSAGRRLGAAACCRVVHKAHGSQWCFPHQLLVGLA